MISGVTGLLKLQVPTLQYEMWIGSVEKWIGVGYISIEICVIVLVTQFLPVNDLVAADWGWLSYHWFWLCVDNIEGWIIAC